jgi:hypothetical protein
MAHNTDVTARGEIMAGGRGVLQERRRPMRERRPAAPTRPRDRAAVEGSDGAPARRPTTSRPRDGCDSGRASSTRLVCRRPRSRSAPTSASSRARGRSCRASCSRSSSRARDPETVGGRVGVRAPASHRREPAGAPVGHPRTRPVPTALGSDGAKRRPRQRTRSRSPGARRRLFREAVQLPRLD